MATRYKLYPDIKGQPQYCVKKIEDNGTTWCIPTKNAEGNTDYQEYLEWVAAGNTAEAAD